MLFGRPGSLFLVSTDVEAALQREVAEKEAAQTTLAGAAHKLEIELCSNASLSERVTALMVQGGEWMKRTLRHGGRGAFAILAAQYEIDFDTVGHVDFVDTFEHDEIQEILTRTHLPANQLAALFEEGALPRGGRALISFSASL